MAGLEAVYLAVSVLFLVLFGYAIILTMRLRKQQSDLMALKQMMEKRNGS